MTTFVFDDTTDNINHMVQTALGVNSSSKFADADVNKAVKIAGSNNYVPVSAGDEIGAFVRTIEPFTVNGGFSFGSVLRRGRILAIVGANQGATPMAVGDFVVADTPAALGTAVVGAAVRTGAPTKFLWQCIRLVEGTGTAGKRVILERV